MLLVHVTTRSPWFLLWSGFPYGFRRNFLITSKPIRHSKPDYNNVRFALFVGTAPSQAGNPFKRQGRLLAEARAKGKLEYMVIDPALNVAANHSSGDRARWVPIKPGTDTALAMGLIRWLLEKPRLQPSLFGNSRVTTVQT